MSGPNPGSGDQELDGEPGLDHAGDAVDDIDAIGDLDEIGDVGKADETEAYSRAYSAPESEQFVSGPYVPVDPLLYDYDSYPAPDEVDGDHAHPRWPWVVGVTTIVAAIALVVSVALLVARTETSDLATPDTSTPSATPPSTSAWNDISTTAVPPPPPPPPTS
ncbi:hypothetical protein E2F47_13430, partial [Mycobacterium eburneum]